MGHWNDASRVVLGISLSLLASSMAACSSGDIGTHGNPSCADGHCEATSSGDGGSGASGPLFGGSGPGASTGEGAGDVGAGGACPDVHVNFEKVIPTVVLLIDQSGSMTTSFGGGSRWSVLHDTLMDPSTGIVKELENEVRFGLALYSGDGGANCPAVTEVTTSLGNYAAIASVYNSASPFKETPTGESI